MLFGSYFFSRKFKFKRQYSTSTVAVTVAVAAVTTVTVRTSSHHFIYGKIVWLSWQKQYDAGGCCYVKLKMLPFAIMQHTDFSALSLFTFFSLSLTHTYTYTYFSNRNEIQKVDIFLYIFWREIIIMKIYIAMINNSWYNLWFEIG